MLLRGDMYVVLLRGGMYVVLLRGEMYVVLLRGDLYVVLLNIDIFTNLRLSSMAQTARMIWLAGWLAGCTLDLQVYGID